MKEPILEMRGITKKFGSVTANKDVDLTLYPGEIHALLGENGAGKSTLMNILNGIYKPNHGKIYYKGKKVSIRSPRHAVDMGIGMVHQHFRLIPTLTAAENVFLYMPDCKLILNKKEMEEQIGKWSSEFHLNVDPSALIWQLSVGEQQRVEIVKLLCRGAEILILDEPSAVLTAQEAKEMFHVLRRMADSGKSVVVISHKMNEVMEFADRITVLKGGEVEDTMPASEATVERLTKAVVGERELKPHKNEGGTCREEVVLKLEDLSVKNDRDLMAIKNVSLDIHAGEILGIAGVAGNGQKELAESLIGLRKQKTGELYFDNVSKENCSIKKRKEDGFFWIPEEPKKDIVFRGMTLLEHVEMFNEKIPTTKYGNIDWEKAEEDYEHNPYIEQFRVQEGSKEVASLSGGNIQRMILARAAMANPKFLIASYPSRGLDISTVNMVHKEFIRLRNSGCAILFISEDLDELLHMSDRIVVLYDGKMYGPFFAKEMTYERIGKYMLQGASR